MVNEVGRAHDEEDVEPAGDAIHGKAHASVIEDGDAASLYGMIPVVRTRRSHMRTAYSGVDGLDRPICANPKEQRFAPE